MAAAVQKAKVNAMPNARETIACRQCSTAIVSVTIKRLMLFSRSYCYAVMIDTQGRCRKLKVNVPSCFYDGTSETFTVGCIDQTST